VHLGRGKGRWIDMKLVSIKAGYIKANNHHKAKCQDELSCSRLHSYWSNLQQVTGMKGTGESPGTVTEGIS